MAIRKGASLAFLPIILHSLMRPQCPGDCTPKRTRKERRAWQQAAAGRRPSRLLLKLRHDNYSRVARARSRSLEATAAAAYRRVFAGQGQVDAKP